MLKLLATYLSGSVLVGLITIPATFIYTRLLQPEDYGIALFVISLINLLFCFCNLGMDQSFIRFFYEKKNAQAPGLLILRCLSIILLGFLLLLFSLSLWSENFSQLLKIPQNTISALVIGVFLYTLLRFLQLIPRLLEQASTFLLANGLKNTFSLFGFLIFFYFFSNNYLSLIYAQLVSMLLVIIWLFAKYRHQIVLIGDANSTFFDASEYKTILIYGLPNFFSLSLTWLFANLDKYLILEWSSAKELGIYTAAFELTAPLQAITTTFTTAWAPRMIQMLTHSPIESKIQFSLIYEKLSFVLAFSFILLIFIKEFLILFIGKDFHDAIHIFPWLLFIPFFWALSEVVQAGVIKTKRSYWHIAFSLFTIILNYLLCFLLIPRFGGVGAGIAIAISYLGLFAIRLIVSFKFYAFEINVKKQIFQFLLMLFYLVFLEVVLYKVSLFLIIAFSLMLIEIKWLRGDVSKLIAFLKQKRAYI